MNSHLFSVRRYYQKGAATLFTALALLIGITLVTLFSAKTAYMEQKISGNQYRTIQATSAANAAMEYGVAFFDNGGFDQDDNNTVDYTAAAPFNMTFTSADGLQTTTANIYFDNDDNNADADATDDDDIPCATSDDADPTFKAALITAQGFSDDGIGSRTITQCVGTLDIYGGKGPEQPMIARAAVGLTGNASIINRYSNMTIWSGDPVSIGNSVAMSTYIRPDGVAVSDLTEAELMDDDPDNNAEKVSSKRLGNGVDIVENDPRLGDLTGDEFFNNFINESKSQMERMAENIDQHYPSGGNVSSEMDGKSGIFWVDADASLNNNITIGSSTRPAVVIINGDLQMTGGVTIYGLLYVVGQLDVAGTITVFGSTIVEGSGLAAGTDSVVGNGTLNLVYAPTVLGDARNPLAGTTTALSGSWRDWDYQD